MSCKDILDCVGRERSIPEGIGLEVVEGPGDGDLVQGYRVGVQGSIDKLISDDELLFCEVAGELDW